MKICMYRQVWTYVSQCGLCMLTWVGTFWGYLKLRFHRAWLFIFFPPGELLEEDSDISDDEMDDSEDLKSVFTSNMEEAVYEHQSPDFINFRVQLWKGMHKFPEKCEIKSKVFVPLFFDFLR